MHGVRQNFYSNGPRPSKLLVLQFIIYTIHSPTKGQVTNSREINNTFADHFKDIYQPENSTDMVECHELIKNICLEIGVHWLHCLFVVVADEQ